MSGTGGGWAAGSIEEHGSTTKGPVSSNLPILSLSSFIRSLSGSLLRLRLRCGHKALSDGRRRRVPLIAPSPDATRVAAIDA